MKRLSSKGFTIIELLISTVVFSVILLIVTAAIIQISNVYYNGTANTKTREVARSVVDDIAKRLQYSKAPAIPLTPPGMDGAYCVGGTLYKYKKNQKVTGGSHALVVSSNCAAVGGLFGPGDEELLGEFMQIRNFSIDPATNTITITVGYGDDSDFNASNECKFKVSTGGQFCAVATYTTTVTNRVQ